MRGGGRQGRPTAPRGASMLEMEKYGNEAAGAPSWNRSDARASRQSTRAARMAAGEWCFCLRNIVNLKSRRRLPRAFKRRCAPPMSRFRSEPFRRALVQQVNSRLPLAIFPARTLAGVTNWQAIRRVDNPAPACPRYRRPPQDGSRQNAPLNQRTSQLRELGPNS
jgi:hypothetical protein